MLGVFDGITEVRVSDGEDTLYMIPVLLLVGSATPSDPIGVFRATRRGPRAYSYNGVGTGDASALEQAVSEFNAC